MHRFLPSIVAVCLIALMTHGATAGGRDRFEDKFHERIETLTMWRMMQALDLDTETSKKILQIRGKFLSQRKELRSSLHQAYQDLKEYLKEEQSKENDMKLAATIDKIRKTRKELRAVWEQQFDAVAKVLPVRKQAELVIFMRDFRKEIKAMLSGPGGRPQRPPFDRGYHRGPGGPTGEPGGPPPGRQGRLLGPTPGWPRDNPGPPMRLVQPNQWDASDDSDVLPSE